MSRYSSGVPGPAWAIASADMDGANEVDMTWHPDIPLEFRNQIVTGDARILAERIPDESIDLIFTDPVYDRIDDYRWLAKTAKRVLKKNGSLLIYCGIGYLPEIFKSVNGSLSYRWQIVPHTVRRYKHLGLLKNSYQSLLWFEKGDAKLRRPWMDCQIVGSEFSSRHRINGVNWGKHPTPTRRAVEALTNRDFIILDTYTGGGTVPAVCKMLQRNYIAFEIDEDTAELARERVRNTQPPLPLQYHKQMELI